MAKILFFYIALLLPIYTYSQEYRTVNLDNVADYSVTKYDSLSNIEGGLNIQDYKKFIGQEITFLQRNPANNNLPVAYANFEATHKIKVSSDTIWHKKRKKNKPTDYDITDNFTDRYAPQYYKSSWITYCGVDHFGYVPPKSSNNYNYYDHDSIPGLINRTSGYYTPYQEIEGKTFKILDIEKAENKLISNMHSLRFTLLSERGDSLYWYAQSSQSFPNRNDIYYPIIVKGYIDKIRNLYLGKHVYVYDENAIRTLEKPKKFLYSEFVFAGEKNKYSIPCLILEDENNKKVLLPLCKTPTLFSYEYEGANIDKFYPYLSLNNTAIEDAQVYEDRMKKEAAEKEIKRREREEYLCKKFGKTDGKIILEGKVRVGMTKAMVVESWGFPAKGINKTTGSYGTHEQWCYGDRTYLYFENGKLTTIQN